MMMAKDSDLEAGGEDKSIFEGDFLDMDEDEAAYFFGQHAAGIISGLSKDWLLLDSQSSTDEFCNEKYLTKSRDATQPTIIHCNTGVVQCDKEGVFKSVFLGTYH